jgi:hypothetical protein
VAHWTIFLLNVGLRQGKKRVAGFSFWTGTRSYFVPLICGGAVGVLLPWKSSVLSVSKELRCGKEHFERPSEVSQNSKIGETLLAAGNTIEASERKPLKSTVGGSQMAAKEKKLSNSFPLRLSPSMRRQVEHFAGHDGVSINQFICLAVAEKVMRMDGYSHRRERYCSPINVRIKGVRENW